MDAFVGSKTADVVETAELEFKVEPELEFKVEPEEVTKLQQSLARSLTDEELFLTDE